jgi:hypothetical protein
VANCWLSSPSHLISWIPWQAEKTFKKSVQNKKKVKKFSTKDKKTKKNQCKIKKKKAKVRHPRLSELFTVYMIS